MSAAATDSLGFLDAVSGLPEQLAAAHEAAGERTESHALPDAESIRNIVVLGMGGSGISGDVLNSVSSGVLPVPVTVLKQIRTPRFVGPGTLAFAVSYSGNTEETRSMAQGALEAGAHLVTVSSGGALAELPAAAHFPCPPGLMPRAALGALVAPMFVTLFRMGLMPEAHALLVRAQQQLAHRRDQCRPEVEGDANPARELARKIDRTIPLIQGGGALGAVAAMRWKCDVNENAKAPAFWSAHPELDHNEICGFGQHGDVTRQVLTLVELRHGFEHERLAPRFEFTRGLIEECVSQVLEVQAEGEGRLAQLLDLMYVGDWTSCYLALANDVDPGPIDAIAALKAAIGVTEAPVPLTFSTAGTARRVDKPWGHEILWTPADRPYVGKLLHIDAGKRLSLQVHDAKEESWFLMAGRAKVVWDDGSGELVETELEPGLGYSCEIGQRHRLVGITDCDILEVSTPEIGTTHRLQDDYARPDETEAVRSSPDRGWGGPSTLGARGRRSACVLP